jgi:predicted nucleic acid-binding protein
MGQQYLIDSNAVIDYLSGKLPEKGMVFMNEVINDIPNISVITKIEVLGYKTTPEADQLLTGFVDDSVLLSLTDEVIEQTIQIRKEYKLKTPDAIIAATALIDEYILISRNTKDFKNIQGLDVVNPHEV